MESEPILETSGVLFVNIQWHVFRLVLSHQNYQKRKSRVRISKVKYDKHYAMPRLKTHGPLPSPVE